MVNTPRQITLEDAYVYLRLPSDERQPYRAALSTPQLRELKRFVYGIWINAETAYRMINREV